MAEIRNDFSRMREQYRKIGKGNVRLTQSTLILVKPINPTSTNYLFDLLETQTTTLLPEELRLNINDEFIATQIGVYLYGKQAPGEVLPPPAAAVTNRNFTLTYAPVEQTPLANSVQALWQGNLAISVNNIKFIEKYDTKKNEYIPRTQFENFAPALIGTQSTKSTQPDVDYSRRGMYNVTPQITLSGAKKTDINLVVPRALAALNFLHTANDGTKSTFQMDSIMLIIRGFNAQNAARFQ